MTAHEVQAYLFEILIPIYSSTAEGRALFMPEAACRGPAT